MSTPSKEPSSRAQSIIAAAPVEVVAELGRVLLRAEEVLALEAGSVLAFAPLQSELISLRVGSRTWARGELVDVEGRLGVRLTRIVSEGS